MEYLAQGHLLKIANGEQGFEPSDSCLQPCRTVEGFPGVQCTVEAQFI